MSTALRAALPLLLALAAVPAAAQTISLTGAAYTQDFDGLSNTEGSTTNTTLPAGWSINETGGGARDNEQYAVGNGSSNSGDTYSFGAVGSTDRALGGLLSGSLNPTIGACFTNNTGSPIADFTLGYTGEQWRVGTTGRQDALLFEWSTDATSLTTGTWIAVPAFNFQSPNTAVAGATDGNDAANRQRIEAAFGANMAAPIANGSTFCLRWRDLNASGADDGLAVDEFVLTPADPGDPAPDFSVAMTATPNPVGQGTGFEVRTVFANVGTVDIPLVTASQPIPAYVATPINLISYADAVGGASASCSRTGSTVNCTLNLPAGSSIAVIGSYIAAGDAVGPLDFTFTGAPPAEDTNDGNDAATVSLGVIRSLAIHDIQGSGRNSPATGEQVLTRGIVTAVRTAGYYLQTPDAEADANPLTSEGIYVFTGNGNVPAQAAVGNLIEISGNVVEYTPSSNPHQQPLTELTGTTVTSLVSTGNALPAPVEITAALADPAGPVDNLERLEGMRVSIANLTATAPGEGFIDENDALSSANGNFWGVVEGVARPFREEGVGALDVTPGLPANTPVFDTNPERIRVQSTGQVGAPVIALDAGATVTGLVGVLDYGFGTYTLLPDPGAPVVVEGGAEPLAVADATAAEYTIAGFNLLRFYDDVNDAGGDTVLTTVAFERRVAKTARAICEYVRLPDILGVVEVENLNALGRLADAINGNLPGGCDRNPQYVPYLVEGNDVGKINIGFLVSTAEVRAGVPRVEVIDVTQYGKTELINNPNGSTSTLHDRPPLVLRAVVNAPNGAASPVTVIGNHLLSLIDINSLDPGSNGYATTGDRRRAKRALQAEYTAALIEQIQQDDPSTHLVLLGDFNAFEFNDGYVDVMGVLTGREAPADQVLQYVDSPITVPLTNMTTLAPEGENYSFSFEGNAQTLDHLVVNQALLDAATLRTEHARINADFGVDNYGDDAVPLRVSDHDPVVLYVAQPGFLDVDLGITASGPANGVAGEDIAFQATVSNPGPDAAADVLVTFRADAALEGLAVTAPAGFACAPAVVAVASTTVECAADEMPAGNAAFALVASSRVDTVFAGGALALEATVSTTNSDTNPANDTAVASVSIAPPMADLAAYVAVAPSPITYGREATVGFSVRNRGPNAAPATRMSVVFTNNLEQILPQPPAGWSCAEAPATRARREFRCDYAGGYAIGRNDILRFTVRAVRSTSVTATATASSAAIDERSNNDKASASFTVGLGAY